MTHVHLAHALVIRNGAVLMVASRYANHDEPLWNLPGGRQRFGELLSETAQRELLEETGLHGVAAELAYVNESYDGDRHFVAAIFHTTVRPGALQLPSSGDHVTGAAWIAFVDVPARNIPPVVCEPLSRYLRGELPLRYAARHDAGVSVRWGDEL
ncbi:MAG TPA: NUDIX domain-containing protein [Candidatus Tumulicola sp.]|jgi:ADP-ribose pyrophosphatase YjhB (NUDIX family)